MNEQVFESLSDLINAVTAAGFPTLANVHGDLPLQGRYRIQPGYLNRNMAISIWQEGEDWVYLATATHAQAGLR